MTAADLARSVAAGLAIAFALTALILILRPAQSPEPIFVPSVFSPAPVASHCAAAALSPPPLHGLARCTP
jgi:hypothetical protein